MAAWGHLRPWRRWLRFGCLFFDSGNWEAPSELRRTPSVAVEDNFSTSAVGGSPIALVICELKLSFTLDLVLQAVDRSTACDEVWLAVRASLRGRGRESDPRVKRLCRLLGFGLLCVFNSGRVEVFVEPAPWRPRHNAKRRSKILDEHRRRKGDPTTGGATRRPIMTAYRQQALACAAALARAPARPRDLKGTIPDAPKILLHNVYGWFVRVERGVYSLSEAGRAAIIFWKSNLPEPPANIPGEPQKIAVSA